jgi:DNA invertase Pin-like site-specific DNA recombinase
MMRYAEARDWRIDPDLMFSDEAISGAGLDRPGFQALLRAAKATPRSVDVVLVDDTSRLSRSLADTVRLREELSFRGIRLIAVSQGIDSNDEQADVMMTVHGLVDSLYVKELAKKTHRGLEGLALTGFHTGGSCYGYQSEKVGDKTRLRIDEEEAAVVRRIFEMSAAGFSLKRIAKQLNGEGVPPPRGTKKKTRPSWVFTAIREMLRRDLYRGRIVWNRRKFKKRPGTNKRVSVLRPESEWVITDEPELRIVPDDLWNRVQERRLTVAAKHPGVKPGLLHRAATVPYLFSGLLKCGECGECGANLTILTGRGKDRKSASYGCPHHFTRGTCSNDLYQRRDRLEETLLSGLQRFLLDDDVIDETLAKVLKAVTLAESEQTGAIRDLRAKQIEIGRELRNLTDAICKSGRSEFLLRAIRSKEAELSSLTIDLRRLCSGASTNIDREDLRSRIEEEVADLPALLNIDPVRAKAELQKHLSGIRMVPTERNGNRFYVAEGEWDMTPEMKTGSQLFDSEENPYFRMVAGAGFEPATFGL